MLNDYDWRHLCVLQANLPLLQRELAHCARLARQTPQQYLANNEHAIFDCATGGSSPLDHQDITADFNENGKRHSPDRWETHLYID